MVVAGFSLSRSGNLSFTSGSFYTQARAALQANFVNVNFTNLDVLTTSNLAGADLLIIGPGTTDETDGTPLSTNEQSALLGYVQNGGGLILMSDNYSFASGAPAEEQALLSPFGMSGSGSTGSEALATVLAPGADPLTGGPFGTVTTFTENVAGGITNIGTYAIALATNSLGVALAEILPGTLGPGSGPVAITTDVNTWADDDTTGYFSANQAFFLNTVAWARRAGGSPPLIVQGVANLIAGFSLSRSGNLSFTSGSFYTQARAALQGDFVNVNFTNLDVLTTSNLAGVDLLIIGPGTTDESDGTPLSTNEQSALLGYVQNGGGLILMSDNYSFASGAPAEEQALLSPFGISGSGSTGSEALATVLTPGADPLTGGPFGTVTTFTENVAGGITNIGPYASALATNSIGVALAEILPGTLGPGSGPVAITTDVNTWADDATTGYFSANETFFLNTVTWARKTGGLPLLSIASQERQMVINWPAGAVGFSLEFTTNLDSTASWQPVTQTPAVVGLQNVVTNTLPGSSVFFRLHKQ